MGAPEVEALLRVREALSYLSNASHMLSDLLEDVARAAIDIAESYRAAVEIGNSSPVEFLKRLEERKLVKWSQTVSRVREEVERAESVIRSLGARRS
jgi:hypothetical protein